MTTKHVNGLSKCSYIQKKTQFKQDLYEKSKKTKKTIKAAACVVEHAKSSEVFIMLLFEESAPCPKLGLLIT